MKVPFLDLKSQYKSIKKEIDSAIKHIHETSAYVAGPAVAEFEEKFAKYIGVKHAIAVSTGTDALHIALRALGIGPGDEVITVTNTFIATAEAISLAGATPVFVDIDEKTYLMDLDTVESKITKKTKAIIPVHLYGQVVDMEKLRSIAKKHSLPIIEDACQAHGSLYKKSKAGSLGDFGCFSFYPGKNLGTYGEGGAITTNNDEYAAFARLYRDHGAKVKYQHDIVGGNFRMSGIEGAVLGVKLPHLDRWNNARRKHAVQYKKLLSKVSEIILGAEPASSTGNYHLYIIRTKRRKELADFLGSKGIATGIHYPTPVHLQRAYSSLGLKEGDFPVSEKVSKEILSLPMFPELTEKQIAYVGDSIKSFFKQ